MTKLSTVIIRRKLAIRENQIPKSGQPPAGRQWYAASPWL